MGLSKNVGPAHDPVYLFILCRPERFLSRVDFRSIGIHESNYVTSLVLKFRKHLILIELASHYPPGGLLQPFLPLIVIKLLRLYLKFVKLVIIRVESPCEEVI